MVNLRGLWKDICKENVRKTRLTMEGLLIMSVLFDRTVLSEDEFEK